MEPQQRPGGRSARVRDAVRQATLAELAEHGYQGLTIDNVAQRSGVHKTTVYRRWRNAEGLIADALEIAENEPWPIPDTGTALGDLHGLGEEVRTGFADPETGPVASAFITAAMQNPAAAAALHRFFAARHEQSAQVVHRAMERGELPENVDPDEVVRFAIAPIYYRLFISHEPITAEDTERSARAAIAAARAGMLESRPRTG
ncbi:TetR/AcrR family transcriptional regulator [Nocardia donostiensis]|uniref:TetR family transcriptional regulator n=1 Tax=Nocardia donostiensis TaxID=1538463 RepID=A0A1V2TJJ0_9NOCA|nr:TetR/AcrR family transcriptional regulator [Nocardia donostiensis]ONM49685.1 TetR family transcriptional regulator [Nocardia donostiensis]OQS15431.1 TetR family transcriptional regulator [Nocardia donostiensis]OQS17620.1 TetR family transcriptional regulator [Nocardia donostiensis]